MQPPAQQVEANPHQQQMQGEFDMRPHQIGERCGQEMAGVEGSGLRVAEMGGSRKRGVRPQGQAPVSPRVERDLLGGGGVGDVVEADAGEKNSRRPE